MQAKLPKSLEAVGLKDIVKGESVYTVPWAMYADNDGTLWLNGNYSFKEESQGTLQLQVTRSKDNKYIVDVTQCKDSEWELGGGSFVGEFTPIPVSELIGM